VIQSKKAGEWTEAAALAWALEQRLIAGSALDVYENEPAVHPDLDGPARVTVTAGAR